jgi:hypothetical protein
MWTDCRVVCVLAHVVRLAAATAQDMMMGKLEGTKAVIEKVNEQFKDP